MVPSRSGRWTSRVPVASAMRRAFCGIFTAFWPEPVVDGADDCVWAPPPSAHPARDNVPATTIEAATIRRAVARAAMAVGVIGRSLLPWQFRFSGPTRSTRRECRPTAAGVKVPPSFPARSITPPPRPAQADGYGGQHGHPRRRRLRHGGDAEGDLAVEVLRAGRVVRKTADTAQCRGRVLLPPEVDQF